MLKIWIQVDFIESMEVSEQYIKEMEVHKRDNYYQCHSRMMKNDVRILIMFVNIYLFVTCNWILSCIMILIN